MTQSEPESNPVPASERVAAAASDYVAAVINQEIENVTWEIKRQNLGAIEDQQR